MTRFDLNSYVTVQARINKFWEENPDGRIESELMSPPSNFAQCRYVARIYKHKDDERAAASGWAFEVAIDDPRGGPNYTAHEENCETSAIGRAFANLGYATSQTDRPSREEMEKVERGRSDPVGNGNGSGGVTSWTEAWKSLRHLKITNAEEFGIVTGHDISKGLSPQEAIDLAKSCLEDVAASHGE